MTQTRPLILVTNDDGVNAPGIVALRKEMAKLGDVVSVAPDQPQSGMGHAVTLNNTLRVNRLPDENGMQVFSTSGTPVDCVKLAVNVVLPRKPDLIVSGINHGANSSVNVIYSGTMSAAVEGCMENIPSIGFSLLDHSIDADFTASCQHANRIASQVLERGLPQGVCLNVNIPRLKPEEIMGVKVCRQADANWEEEFDSRVDPGGKEYYWLTGKFVNRDKGEDTDIWALDHNYVSVVPVRYDMTAHQVLPDLKEWLDV